MNSKGISALEGFGYVAAVLIGFAGINESLRLFHVGGLMLSLIVIVRLLAFVATLSDEQANRGESAAPAAAPAEGKKEEVTQ